MRRLLSSHPFRVPEYNQHYEGAYDQRGLEWRRLGAVDKAQNLAFLLGSGGIDSVLEFGCGTGAVLAQVAKLGIGSRHVGVDLADPNQHRDPGAAGLDLRLISAGELPFATDAFDLVYASHVIEHLPDPRKALLDMARVAKKFLYIEVPCELHLRSNQRDLQRTLDIGHINAYTPESLQLLLESCGLQTSKIGVFDHSLQVHCFAGGQAKGLLKYALRRSLLALNPTLASRVFTYHCGALVRL